MQVQTKAYLLTQLTFYSGFQLQPCPPDLLHFICSLERMDKLSDMTLKRHYFIMSGRPKLSGAQERKRRRGGGKMEKRQRYSNIMQ